MDGEIVRIFIAIMTGLIFSVQGSINSLIGKGTSQYIMVVGVSLIQAALASLIIIVSSGNFTSLFSPLVIISGILGMAIMYGFSTSIGSLGALKVFALVLVGQVIASTIIDHFGLFGVERSPVNIQRIASSFIIILGVFWLVKS